MDGVLETLVEANNEENRLKAALAAKAQGKKIIGYLCNYVPQEVIYAADMFPFRMLGTWRTDTRLADSYMTPQSCSYCRNVLQAGLQGK